MGVPTPQFSAAVTGRLIMYQGNETVSVNAGIGTSGVNVPLLNGANTWSAAQSITDATASTSTTTGALKVTGGIATQNNVWSSGIFSTAINAGGASAQWFASVISAETAVSSSWPVAIKGNDRGILYLGTAAAIIYAFFTQGTTANNVGAISGTTTATTYATSSDGRKKPIRYPIDDALGLIGRLKVYRHNWLNEPDTWTHGVVAQEAVDVLPEMIVRGDDDTDKRPGDQGFEPWNADYSKAVPLLIAAVQQLARMNEKMKEEIEWLKSSQR